MQGHLLGLAQAGERRSALGRVRVAPSRGVEKIRPMATISPSLNRSSLRVADVPQTQQDALKRAAAAHFHVRTRRRLNSAAFWRRATHLAHGSSPYPPTKPEGAALFTAPSSDGPASDRNLCGTAVCLQQDAVGSQTCGAVVRGCRSPLAGRGNLWIASLITWEVEMTGTGFRRKVTVFGP